LLARHIDQADVLGLEEPFAMQRRRTKDLILGDADGNIPVIRRREPLGINPSPDLANVLLEFM
jgi:hypothetical protein